MVDTTKIQALDNFMVKAQQASRLGSKELRMTAQEAFELSAAIGQILTQNLALRQKISDTEALIGASIRVDGGRFG